MQRPKALFFKKCLEVFLRFIFKCLFQLRGGGQSEDVVVFLVSLSRAARGKLDLHDCDQRTRASFLKGFVVFLRFRIKCLF